jgi:hypothetical protein
VSPLFNRGFGPNPTNAPFTLAALEQQIADLRAYGAPDDAEVIRTPPWAYHLFEIQWVAP